MELQEKVGRVQELRLLDDVFFEVFAEDIPACQEILRTILEDDQLIVDDGLHEIFVNTLIKDGSRISDLMTCFSSKEVHSTEFPAVTKRFNELKYEGGASAVSDVMDKYLDEARKEERLKAIQKMIQKGLDKKFISSLDYTEEEISEAEATLMATV